MNFLAGFGKKKELSGKDKNIKDFRKAFPKVRRPYNDDNVMEILFQIKGEYNTLRINIIDDFPITKPGNITINHCCSF